MFVFFHISIKLDNLKEIITRNNIWSWTKIYVYTHAHTETHTHTHKKHTWLLKFTRNKIRNRFRTKEG